MAMSEFKVTIATRMVKLHTQKLLDEGELTIEQAKKEMEDMLSNGDITQETYNECIEWLNNK